MNDALRLQSYRRSRFNTSPEAGLIKQRQDSSPYDAFRGRVIFPIIDATGGGGKQGTGRNVIAFGGRILEEKRDEAGNAWWRRRYLNSPDSKLYSINRNRFMALTSPGSTSFAHGRGLWLKGTWM